MHFAGASEHSGSEKATTFVVRRCLSILWRATADMSLDCYTLDSQPYGTII
jgi:hypothetical protein